MESQHGLALITLLLATIFAYMEANSKILFVSSVATLVPSLICSRIPGLSPKQIAVCEENPKVINCIRDGYRKAAEECRFQFRKSRWNCTLLGETSDFDDKAIPGTKEAAYTQAIISAGVVYTISRACSSGNLSECNCDKKLRGKKSHKGWSWGGCSVDLSYGLNLSSRFVNARHNTHDAIWLMNRHNSRAGRQVVKQKLVRNCKCHGVSGTCTLQTCWKALPSLRHIAENLKQLYHAAKRVREMTSMTPGGQKPEHLVLQSDNSKKPESHSLVYLNDSKAYSYCLRDPNFRIPGTRDRTCNNTSSGNSEDRCGYMCCGRGHNTHNITKVKECNCKFHWCCVVKCEWCVENIVRHTCK